MFSISATKCKSIKAQGNDDNTLSKQFRNKSISLLSENPSEVQEPNSSLNPIFNDIDDLT